MTVLKETYIGDKKAFAIRYAPVQNSEYTPALPACCHLVLGGQIIGNPDEPCHISTWINALNYHREFLQRGLVSLSNGTFTNRSDEEIFHLIWTHNEPDGRFSPTFQAILDNDPWENCRFYLDETTSAYIMAMAECDGVVKFLWQDYPAQEGELSSVNVDKWFVVETMEKALNRLQTDFSEILHFLESKS